MKQNKKVKRPPGRPRESPLKMPVPTQVPANKFMKPKKPDKQTRSMADITAAAKNPRTITQARLRLLKRQLVEYGDLGGIVFNRRTKELVSGHQRMTEFNRSKADIKIERTYDLATKSGTVAEGFILVEGERFGYREVDWPKEKAAAALLAANNHAGEWDQAQVRELIKDVASQDMEMTGFTNQFVKSLLVETTEGFQNDETDKVPREREVYILPIALTRKQWGAWEKIKTTLGVKGCKSAFLKLAQIEPA